MIHCGDCLDVMRGMEPNSVDAIVTDPPAGIAFMNKSWDKNRGGRNQWIEWMAEIARECLRVLKPGGYALVWALPRTSHWTATAWEDAGFAVRDRIAHVFGSGFPKSRDVSKAIDKAAGAKREVVGTYRISGLTPDRKNFGANDRSGGQGMGFRPGDIPIVAPATDAAKQWDGWGTALKPAMEDWWLLRKPLSEKTVAANVQKWGCGCIHIDASRIPVSDTRSGGFGKGHRPWTKGDIGNNTTYEDKQGRWPANLIHDGSEEVLELFPETTTCGGEKKTTHDAGMFGIGQPGRVYNKSDGENKSAARFFKSFPLRERTATGICQASRLKYCSKASRAEREAGCEGMEERDVLGAVGMPIVNNGRGPEYLSHGKEYERKGKAKNHHPTVKPLALMRYLVRLVTPPNGTILDPFMGSGTTGMAAKAEGFEFIGIEKDLEYVAIAERRIEATA